MHRFPRDYRVNKRQPCPICGKPDWCLLDPAGNWAICMRVCGGKPTRNGGWFYPLSEQEHRLVAEKPTTRVAELVAPDRILDVAYRSLLQFYGVEVRCNDPRLWPETSSPRVVESDPPVYTLAPLSHLPLLPEVPLQNTPRLRQIERRRNASSDLVVDPVFAYLARGYRIPGLYHSREWRWRTTNAMILLPCYNLRQEMVGITLKTGGTPKYIWYTSSGLPNGCGATARCCVLGKPEKEWWVVEGILKAYRVHWLTGKPVVGLPGINTFPSILPLLLAVSNGTQMIVAPDLDWRTNSMVGQQLQSAMDLVLKISPSNVRLAYWEWGIDSEGKVSPKGPDDALLAGERIEIVSWATYRHLTQL